MSTDLEVLKSMLAPGDYPPFVKITKFVGLFGSDQFQVDFANGWGASVINTSHSFGIEVALIDLATDQVDMTVHWDDVRGWQTPETFLATLWEISRLPNNEELTERQIEA